MSETNMIPMEDALKTGFETSSREELQHYCALLGIDKMNPKAPLQSYKDAINAALGFAPTGAPDARRPAPPKSKVIPPVNLTPHGRWGGRRRRITLPRPDGNTQARAASFGWNGKATYWLPYDEPTPVPYPIYMIIKDTKKPRSKRVETLNPDGSREMTTGWDHVSIPFNDHGDDPLTATLPVSLNAWYQEKGQKFYVDLGERDLRTVASKLDIPTTDADKRLRPHADVLNDVLVFLYGYAESDAEAA